MKAFISKCIFLFLALFCLSGYTQSDSLVVKQRDLKDVYYKVFKIEDSLVSERDYQDKKAVFSLLPAPSSSSTGAERALVISFVTTFYLSELENTNMSTISFTPSFTFSNQYIFPVQTYLYTKGNKIGRASCRERVFSSV